MPKSKEEDNFMLLKIIEIVFPCFFFSNKLFETLCVIHLLYSKNKTKKVIVLGNIIVVLSAGGVFGSSFTGYVQLASQNPYVPHHNIFCGQL